MSVIDGSQHAAKATRTGVESTDTQIAILISCVGRKLVLMQRTEEEVEVVRDTLGEQAYLAGFYSYGEIFPLTRGGKCSLHNQTMTITTFAEV
jgi:hypothetical protein